MKILFITDNDRDSKDYLESNISPRWIGKELYKELCLSPMEKPNYTHIVLTELDPKKGTLFSQVSSEIELNDIIFFDFGGLSVDYMAGGGCKMIDYWCRTFIKIIEERPNKIWVCISCVQTFDHDEKNRLKKLGVKFAF